MIHTFDKYQDGTFFGVLFESHLFVKFEYVDDELDILEYCFELNHKKITDEYKVTKAIESVKNELFKIAEADINKAKKQTISIKGLYSC